MNKNIDDLNDKLIANLNEQQRFLEQFNDPKFDSLIEDLKETQEYIEHSIHPPTYEERIDKLPFDSYEQEEIYKSFFEPFNMKLRKILWKTFSLRNLAIGFIIFIIVANLWYDYNRSSYNDFISFIKMFGSVALILVFRFIYKSEKEIKLQLLSNIFNSQIKKATYTTKIQELLTQSELTNSVLELSHNIDDCYKLSEKNYLIMHRNSIHEELAIINCKDNLDEKFISLIKDKYKNEVTINYNENTNCLLIYERISCAPLNTLTYSKKSLKLYICEKYVFYKTLLDISLYVGN